MTYLSEQTARILEEVGNERSRQQKPPFDYTMEVDDARELSYWPLRIVEWTMKVVRSLASFGSARRSAIAGTRKALIETAAICMAAVESLDRKWSDS